MKVATEHPERERSRAGVSVEERLLLHRVELKPRDVTGWHHEPSPLVPADLADPALTGRDQAAVATGDTTDPSLGQRLVQVSYPGQPGKDLLQRQRRSSHPSFQFTSVVASAGGDLNQLTFNAAVLDSAIRTIFLSVKSAPQISPRWASDTQLGVPLPMIK